MQIKNQSLVKSLQKTGFTDKEALVYVALLELGGAYPSRIAEYCGLKRATTYNVLATLSVRGLVNEVEKRNKIFYQIDKPHKLTQYSNSRIEMAKSSLERTEKILPDIEEIFSLMADRPKVLFFEGPDTVETLCDDMVSGVGNYEMLAFSNADKFRHFMSPEKLKKFVKAKEHLNITTRAIIPDTEGGRTYNEHVFGETRKEIWPQIRYVDAKRFPYEAEITIYGKNKVSIVKLGGLNIIGVIIEDQIIHDMMKMVFEIAWGNGELKG